MMFKSIANPKPSKGIKYASKKVVVPNQSMSLQEILTRFTRNEPLPVGREVRYHDSEDDLEKIQHMDLVDRQEYIEKLKDIRRKYDQQEKDKVEQAQKALIEKAKNEVRAELEKQQKQQVPASTGTTAD